MRQQPPFPPEQGFPQPHLQRLPGRGLRAKQLPCPLSQHPKACPAHHMEGSPKGSPG